jgi:ubiquinone/menaquinone biosynthesis C-methylase UbiE
MTEARPTLESGSSGWNEQQREYWSSLATRYDSFYRSRWSQLENDWVRRRLQHYASSQPTSVLDLGCGTGLGAELLSDYLRLDGYVGVDISPSMANLTATRFGVATHVGPMEDLRWVVSDTIDLVICLFSAASFCPDPKLLLTEIHRVLRPGGRAYISVLGRSWTRRERVFRFQTRGSSRSEPTTYAYRYSPSHVRSIVEGSSLVVSSVSGMNTFSGVLEFPVLWRTGAVIARMVPNSSHLIEIECTKPYREEGV